MNTQDLPNPRVERLTTLPQQARALSLLQEAFEAALEEGRDVWQFAVEIGQLRAAGLSHTDLRRLLCRGYLEHARECTGAGDGERIFRRLATLALPSRTCFVLTAKEWSVVSEHTAEKSTAVSVFEVEQSEVSCPVPELPRWDGQSRQLWWQGYLVKEFHRVAINQELVLAALEEESWPARIDDPLPQTHDIDPKVRLHDTIKMLNRNCRHRLIFFRGDGSGRGIRWVGAKRECESSPSLP